MDDFLWNHVWMNILHSCKKLCPCCWWRSWDYLVCNDKTPCQQTWRFVQAIMSETKIRYPDRLRPGFRYVWYYYLLKNLFCIIRSMCSSENWKWLYFWRTWECQRLPIRMRIGSDTRCRPGATTVGAVRVATPRGRSSNFTSIRPRSKVMFFLFRLSKVISNVPSM